MLVLPIDAAAPDSSILDRAAACLRQGGLVAFPTETVYGLGASAFDLAAVERIFVAKGRDRSDPLIVHVASIAMAGELVTAVSSVAAALMQEYWPGPLTIVLPKALHVPDIVTAGLSAVALRCPGHPVALGLVQRAGPIAAPSANRFQRSSATLAAHVLEDLGESEGMLLDAGPAAIGIESTIVAVAGEVVRLLRPGAIDPAALAGIVEGAGATLVVTVPSDSSRPLAPGSGAFHYAPRAPLTLLAAASDPVAVLTWIDAQQEAGRAHVGVLAFDEDRSQLDGRAGVTVATLGPATDLAKVAARLFAAMRELDAAGVQAIVARDFDPEGIGLALHDRLTKAALSARERIGMSDRG